MTQANKLRHEVAKDYADRIERFEGAPMANPETNGEYTEQDLAQVPEDAVGSSFGCGNPVAVADVQPGDTVLDLGSGVGLDLLLARERTGASGKVIGIDMTDEMIERARTNIDKAGYDNVEVRKGLIEHLPVEPNSVDWVISNCVVNLSPEKHKVFDEIARVLKPGGHMLIADIVVNDVPTWLRRVVGLFNSSVAGAISEADYIAGLERAGLGNVEIRDRRVYDRTSIAGMVRDEVGGFGNSWLGRAKASAVRLIAPTVVNAAADRIVSIKVGATKAA